ncbi:MAG: cobalt ECF transporter T component CbiQ [Candidatus Omnitrophica bacterium]|nr:cobalt ECF transporter T component CbiQ [Candidatus Omnitrophota bacterium]
MKHFYIDKYSDIDSPFQRLDARVKVVGFIAFILSIALTPARLFIAFLFYGLLICRLALLSKVPLLFILKRSLVIVPFVLMVTVFIPFFKKGPEGLMIFWNVLIKSSLSICCAVLLTSSTRFTYILKALQDLRCPKLLTTVLSFMYRYIFVVQDELMEMLQAKESRSAGGSRWFNVKALANIAAVLFIKSYERAEAVYLAMCSRGFTGHIHTINDR